ncbi:MAG: hypothetical protein NW216_11375 [Hyphomicrobium sp.]|nr:hypothetical protein [Hyphomicrobium sp.]
MNAKSGSEPLWQNQRAAPARAGPATAPARRPAHFERLWAAEPLPVRPEIAREPPAESADDAYRRGLEDGLAAGMRMTEEATAALRVQAVEDQKAAYVAGREMGFSEALVQIAADIDAMEQRLASVAASILAPRLAERVTSGEVADARSEARRMMALKANVSVSVLGPARQLARWTESLAGLGLDVVAEEADGPDVVIRIGDTEIRSHVEAWLAEIEAAVA